MTGSSVAKVQAAAFRLLKIRARSEKEIRDRLKSKKFSASVVNEVIEHLKDLDYLNDQEFARYWIKARLNKQFGLRRILIELKEKGIDRSIASEQLDNATGQYNELDVAIDLAKKRSTRYKNIEPGKKRRRFFEYLARKGFDIEIIYKALSKI